jgi:hypothetical protein
MSNQITRFERWRQRQPPNSRLFVDLVVDRVVPIFLAAHYVRLTDYGGKDSFEADLARTIALQHQTGAEWGTVEMCFWDLGRPVLVVDFAWLPEICQRLEGGSLVRIPRASAIVGEGYQFFRLMRNRRRNNDSAFGIYRLWPILRPAVFLRKEAEELGTLCVWLIDVLSRPIPPTWIAEGTSNRVDEHARRQAPLGPSLALHVTA